MTDFIDELISIGEGYQLEFKKSLDKSFVTEVCAFANASGGRVLIGVKDNGEKSPLILDNILLSRVQDSINQIEPKIHVELIKHDGILIIDVPEGAKKPYLCSEGFYLRIGPNSQKVSRDVIREMFRHSGEIKFDSLENQNATFEDDFDLEAYTYFLEKAGISNTLNPKRTLISLGCFTKNDKFTNAGVLFFTKSVERTLGQAVCTCVLYKGTNKVKILDRKDYKANMISNIENVVSFVNRHTNLEYIIETLRREDVPEIPEIALREAVVNAFCHRYYFQEGSNITIEVFDDRVTITSFGALPFGLKPDEFGQISVQRNPLIASLLMRVHYIERVGTGIQRIKDAVSLLGRGEVQFKFDGNFFIVTFTRNQPTTPKILASNVPVPKLVTTRQQRILNLFTDNNNLTSDQIQSLLNNEISRRVIRVELLKLKELGYVGDLGMTKLREWFLVKKV